MTVSFRRYDEADAGAVWTLHEWAIAEEGVDPADIPGTEDLRNVRSRYLDVGGEFVVGIDPETGAAASADEAASPSAGGSHSPRPSSDDVPSASDARSDRHLTAPPATTGGALVAMGGYLPNEAGHADERTVPGAAELHRMRVAPTHQRRGIGRTLLEELERRAAADGFDVLLATTAARQASAVAFYPSAGYEAVGRSQVDEYELVHFEKEL